MAQDKPSMSFFPGASDVKITNSNFNEIHGNVTNIRFGDGEFTEIQRNLICDYIANLTVLPDINNNLEKHVLSQSIITLPRAQAAHNDYETKKKSGPCFKGTREALLRELADWLTDADESHIYVLSGLAGIGKSTVAYTIAARADELGLLGASFFFSRDEVDRKSAKKFFTTIAYQLCIYNEEFAQAIGNALLTKRGSAAITKDPQEQLEALIVEPLRNIVQSRSRPIILIVVDALDECDDDGADSVLVGLRRMVQELPPFKVILTTRPQPLVSNDFDTPSSQKMFHLQDIEDKVVNDDIRLYLKHGLSWEQVKARLPGLRRQWRAGDADIDFLARAAGKLFIIASTAILFTLDKVARDPKRQMERLLDAFSQDRTPFKVLNDFYSVIIRNAVPEDCDDYIVERYQHVVGAIMVIQVPLPITTLACLIGREEQEIEGALDNLQSVILIDDDDVPHIYHKSFLDYVTDPGRCKDVNLRINVTINHTKIATRCFEIMNEHLKYNILGLDSPARFMKNAKGLAHQGISDKKLQEKITPWLRYACMHWANHLESANIKDAGLLKELNKFAGDHILHWFEALSLIGRLDSAHRSIHVALRIMPTSSDLHQLLSDCLRFISKFYELIKRSALHTYYSALPFTPIESLLYHRYSKKTVNAICQVIGGPRKWDALIANIDCRYRSVKFSLDSTMFATWSDDYGAKFWDAVTGVPISTISLNLDPLLRMSYRVAIADDFSTVAFAKDKTVTQYSVKDSAPIATFTASTEIQVLALSPKSRIAALLSDGTLCLWDGGKGGLIDHFGGFDAKEATLMFCRTGARLACMSFDGGINQLRDGMTGALITNIDPPFPTRHMLRSFRFSDNGSRLAVLTEEALVLWKSDNGDLVGFTMNASNEMAISVDGSLLATGNGANVQLWDGNIGNSIAFINKIDLTSRVSSLEFPADDTLAIATNLGITIYDIRSRSVISTLPFSPVTLGFSPDCTRLVAVDGHHVLRLWDLWSIKASAALSSGQEKRVIGLAFSQDGARLACHLKDGAIVLFEIATGQTIFVHDEETTVSFGFSPDGRKFAAGLHDRTVRLWGTEDGVPIGSVKLLTGVEEVALSDHLLAVAGSHASLDDEITLWDLRTLDLIDTIKLPISWVLNGSKRLLFSNSGDLLASYHGGYGMGRILSSVTVIDVMKRAPISTFRLEGIFDNMAFSPNNSQLVTQFPDGSFRSLDIVSKEVTHGSTLNDLAQLHYVPLWHGTPVWIFLQGDHWECTTQPRSLLGLFPQEEDPVPVLSIPRDLQFKAWAQGPSTIALVGRDGRVIFVRSSSDDSPAMFVDFSLASLTH